MHCNSHRPDEPQHRATVSNDNADGRRPGHLADAPHTLRVGQRVEENMASEHMPSIRPFPWKKLKCRPAAATYPCNASLKWQFGSQSCKQRQRRLPITGNRRNVGKFVNPTRSQPGENRSGRNIATLRKLSRQHFARSEAKDTFKMDLRTPALRNTSFAIS